jgi:hypothetical protein
MGASPSSADAQNGCGDEAAAPLCQPPFIAYGSGAPNWFGCPIYVGFSLLAVAIIAPQIIDPYPLHGFNGFLTRGDGSQHLPVGGHWRVCNLASSHLALAWTLPGQVTRLCRRPRNLPPIRQGDPLLRGSENRPMQPRSERRFGQLDRNRRHQRISMEDRR